MSVRIGITLCALGFLPMMQGEALITSQQVVAPEPCRPPAIRVRLAHAIPKVTLEVRGSFDILDPYTGEVLGQRLNGKQPRLIETRALGLKWGEEFPGVYQLEIVPTSLDSLVLVDGVPYRGLVKVYDVGGTISLVNEVSVEDYVANQLANQTELLSLDEEVLAALAIVMRSQAYCQANHPRNKYWDVDGQTMNYKGTELLSEQAKAADSIVNGTRFMVLTRPIMGQSSVDVLPIDWVAESQGEFQGKTEFVLRDAIAQVQAGADAAQILQKVVPGVTIQRLLIQVPRRLGN